MTKAFLSWAESIETVFSLAGYGIAAAAWVWQGYRERKRQMTIDRQLQSLGRVDGDGHLAVLVHVGGPADAAGDVKDYVQKNLPRIPFLLAYSAAGEDFADRKKALSVVEDLVQAAAELSSRRLQHIHLFPCGMLAYQVLVGYLISNWCDVTVYHRKGGKDDGYIPLFEIHKDRIHQLQPTPRSEGGQRLTDPLPGKVLQVIPLDAGESPAPESPPS